MHKSPSFLSLSFIKGLKIFFSPFLISFMLGGDPINIDGLFEDWDEVPVLYSDQYGDAISADYSLLKITYDSEFLFIYFKFHDGEFLMQDWNDFQLYIDADNDSSTGSPFHGIGAELEWTFGERSGYKYSNGQQTELYQNDLSLRIAPTITSMEFEIAIARESSALTIDGSQSITQGRIILTEASASGDLIPDELGGVLFSIFEDEVLPPEPIALDRLNDSDIRIVSYNTKNEGILDDDREAHFKRISQALDPDVIALQEHGEWEEIDDVIQSWFPNQQWHASWTYRDLVVLSRFSVIDDANMISSERTMAALLDTESELGENLLIFNSHLSCCSNNDDRQQQADEFAGAWRDWVQNDSGPFYLEDSTPFIHVGDFNYVGYSQQVRTIASGDIENEADYGDDFLPDWDATDIIDLFSRHTHKRMGYTWRNDGSSFNPGKLDYVFYSDATIDTGKHYILNTIAMDDAALDYYGLEWNDTQEASDHLPIVLDILVNDDIGIDDTKFLPNEVSLHFNHPNPFNSSTMISIFLSEPSQVELSVYDSVGKLVNRLFQGKKSYGHHSVNWNGTNEKGQDVASGVYFYMLVVNEIEYAGKMILLK